MSKELESLTSIVLERQVLGSLLYYSDLFFDVENFHDENDYSHIVHKACFVVIRDARQKKEKIDSLILAQRLANVGLKKYEDLDLFQYLESLGYNCFNSVETGKIGCEELHKLRKLRDLLIQNKKVEKFILENKNKDLDVVCSEIDKLNNESITKLSFGQDNGINVFETMEKNIESDAENTNFHQGPFPTINRIFGSITIPSNITLIGARTGANKTNLALFYALSMAIKYQTKIIYCDYGELNVNAIQHRLCAMMTKSLVPYHMIVRRTWRNNPEYVKIVRDVWKRIKALTLIYYDVGNLNPREILSLIRRSYFSKIGRGNTNALLVYDYLKPFEHSASQADWQLMSQFAKDLKTLINNEIPIPAWMSIQMNRLGITNNKKSSQVDDSENSMQIDRVLHNASLGFLLRMKTTDELLEENAAFGQIKMIPVKHREILGDDYQAAFKPVKILDGSWRKNYINLDMRNFYFTDHGDLNSMIAKLSNQIKLNDNHKIDDINL